jgi:hypothetical protein
LRRKVGCPIGSPGCYAAGAVGDKEAQGEQRGASSVPTDVQEPALALVESHPTAVVVNMKFAIRLRGERNPNPSRLGVPRVGDEFGERVYGTLIDLDSEMLQYATVKPQFQSSRFLLFKRHVRHLSKVTPNGAELLWRRSGSFLGERRCL